MTQCYPGVQADDGSINRLALLYRLSRTLITSGDLHDLLTQLLSQTTAATGATHGSIVLLKENPEQGDVIIRAGTGIKSDSAAVQRVLRDGAAGHAIIKRSPVLIDDVYTDKRWTESTIDRGNITPRSAVVVPLLHNDIVTGVITLWHIEQGYFDQDIVELLVIVAAHAAAVIERSAAHAQAQQRAAELAALNHKLDASYALEHQRLTVLSTLHDSALDIATGGTLTDMLNRTAERAVQLVDASSTAIYLLDADQQCLNLVSVYNMSARLLGAQIRIGEGPTGQAATAHRTIVTNNGTPPPLSAATTGGSQHQTMASVPLLWGEQLVGVLEVFHTNPVRRFTNEELQSLQMLCTHAAVSLQNAQLRANVQQNNVKLASALQIKDEFLAMISHELRTPINVISGYSDMLREGFFGALEPEMIASLDRVRHSTDHLLRLVDDILDLSMITGNQIYLTNEPYDFGGVVRDICSSANSVSMAEPHDIVFAYHIELDLPMMYGDVRRASQIVRHIVDNAFKFTKQGSIHVRASRTTLVPDSQDGVCLDVIDTGIGIPEEAQHIVFEAFRQADSSPTRRYGGSGLGLAISSRLVSLMGGTISLQSEVNVGSHFRVVLPTKQGNLAGR